MKTLIFNGSPRINGDTESLLKIVKENIVGEYKVVNAYRCNISACVDCRYCWENPGCVIQDCDNILITSPIYFSELTGKMLDVGSRLQTFFCAKFFRKEVPILKEKRGAVVLIGGGDGRVEKAYETACTLLHHMNSRNIHPMVSSHNTNERPAIEDEEAVAGVRSILEFFGEERRMMSEHASEE